MHYFYSYNLETNTISKKDKHKRLKEFTLNDTVSRIALLSNNDIILQIQLQPSIFIYKYKTLQRSLKVESYSTFAVLTNNRFFIPQHWSYLIYQNGAPPQQI